MEARDIGSHEATFTSEANNDGHFLAIAVFMLLGGLLILAVLLELAMPRYLVGAAIFIAIGMTGIGELRRVRRIELYHVTIHLRSGGAVGFATADLSEATGLSAALSCVR